MSQSTTIKHGLNIWIVPVVLTMFLISETAHARRTNESRGRRSVSDRSDTTMDQGDEFDADDDDQIEDKQGPWKVSVPKVYQKKGYSLRIGRKIQSLNTPAIMIAPKELPSYVALIDSYGRVEERKRTTLNPHLLGGFKPRTYRISGGLGLSRLSGPLVDSYQLSSTLGQYTTEFYYQPGPLGAVTGLDIAGGGSRSSSGGATLGCGTLRFGGVLEAGWFFRSPYFRWHQVMQGGLAVSRYSVNMEDPEKVGTSNDGENTLKAIDGGLGIGPYGSIDSLYMFEHWWWGGRLSVKQESFKQDQTDSPERLDANGSHVQVGIGIIGSLTW